MHICVYVSLMEKENSNINPITHVGKGRWSSLTLVGSLPSGATIKTLFPVQKTGWTSGRRSSGSLKI